MIFDRGSVGMTEQKFEAMSNCMGAVTLASFRDTDFYEVFVDKLPKLEEFKEKFGLSIKTPEQIISNWKGGPYVKFLAGRWFVHQEIRFQVWHELRHQNYAIREITRL